MPDVLDFEKARAACARRDAQALAACLALAADAQTHPLLEKSRIFLSGSPDTVRGALTPPFGATANTALRWAFGATSAPTHKISSRNQDFIAQQSGGAEWGVDQILTRLALERIPAVPGSGAVVGTARDDGIYLLEWVAHYRVLGFSHVFLYTNDNADGSEQLLTSLAKAGVVTVIDNEITGRVPPEVKAFGHALNLLPALWRHEWALFVDSDEFLVPTPQLGRDLPEILGTLERADPQHRFGAVLFDWLWFVSEMQFRRMPGLLMERFQYTREHWLGKCLLRLRDGTSMRRQHCPDLIAGKLLCDSALKEVSLEKFWDRKLPEYAGGQINHYWPKSFEEFVIKKARGAALGGSDNPYDRPYKQFFEWNGLAESCGHHTPDNSLLAAVHSEMSRLRALPDVSEAEAAVERGFSRRLSEIATPEEVRTLYQRNKAAPGPL